MILIGMRDSAYVRRVAVSLKLMRVPFEHRLVSVFRHMDEFRKVNPVIKAPTLVCDDGTVLMDSTLILDYVEATLPAEARLTPVDIDRRRRALHLVGFALSAVDKGVSLVYEREQRPADKRHAAWVARCTEQIHAAFGELEGAAAQAKPWLQGQALTSADVMVACAWRFNQHYNAAEVPASRYPALAAFSARAEALPEFAAVPLD
jgi:glutathione S-transferase